MGYYTNYDLSIDGVDDEEIKLTLIAELRDSSKNAKHALCANGVSYDEAKWYSHKNDLKELSSKHPQYLFKLNGEGEDSGDIWCEYYQDGKYQNCPAIITFAPFDKSKLVN